MKKSKTCEKATQSRGTWFGVNPVTRIIPNKKKYNRKRAKRETYNKTKEV